LTGIGFVVGFTANFTLLGCAKKPNPQPLPYKGRGVSFSSYRREVRIVVDLPKKCCNYYYKPNP